jgi:hypothetical protein
MGVYDPPPLRASLRRQTRRNRLLDDIWVPLGLVEEEIVLALVEQLGRDGVPARCEWVRTGWRFPPRPSRWCLWIGARSYWRADEILGELVPQLLRRQSSAGPAAR